ncbi:MAG: hypothetical protein OXE77_01320 [Flavobacteriaceae bacterium]|nr:hypothetical protein [Flavobacteriaceae bacterium]MCY4268398.1 hypothetical protein [Flavobacteriaceae bacterium]MCY4299935.1 hypothetical protein [Flavobacteriaceae bacterium]
MKKQKEKFEKIKIKDLIVGQNFGIERYIYPRNNPNGAWSLGITVNKMFLGFEYSTSFSNYEKWRKDNSEPKTLTIRYLEDDKVEKKKFSIDDKVFIDKQQLN